MSRATSTFDVRRCRICGCTDEDCSDCIARTGEPCSWVEEDLCSACVTAKPGQRRATAPKMIPHPHARKKPNITLDQLEALKRALDQHNGFVYDTSGVCIALRNRKLVMRIGPGCWPVTPAGRLLIQTQYEALKTVLTERTEGAAK